jgi:hypothetical protein
MLSTRRNVLFGFERDAVGVNEEFSTILSSAVPLPLCCTAVVVPISDIPAPLAGASTKRLAGVTFAAPTPSSSARVFEARTVTFGIGAAKPCRKLDCGFGFDFCVEGGWGARKR